MRKIIFLLIPVGILLTSFSKGSVKTVKPSITLTAVPISEDAQRLIQHVQQIKEYVKTNPKYNTEFAFFIDMRIMSGKNRFIVYDLQNDVIVDQGLVSHGIGSVNGGTGVLKFSNNSSSFCTSLGKYAVGQNYFGKYGKSYKLYGLEQTNNNAVARNIVLHKYEYVPYEEQSQGICNSLGCPMVNEKYYARIQKIIDSSKANIILDIYY